MNVKRDVISRIEDSLFKDRVILIFGTRRVGKTTIVKQLLEKYETEIKKTINENYTKSSKHKVSDEIILKIKI